MYYSEKHPNLQNIERQIEDLRNRTLSSYFFRGQADSSWLTSSTLVRNNSNKSLLELIDLEKSNVENFCQSSETKIFDHPYGGNLQQWYWIMQTQHNRIPTRLLDWTPDWVRALFFVLECEEHDDKDGAILYTRTGLNTVLDEDLAQINPYSNERYLMICPAIHHTNEFPRQLGMTRISRQIGKFLLAPIDQIKVPLEEGYNKHFAKLTVLSSEKKNLRQELKSLAVNSDSMYYPQYG